MTYNLAMEIFQIKHNNIQPEQGKILLSEPFMRDSYFGRAVILLTEHNSEGSVGLILNKPLDITINDVINHFPDFPAKVFAGGPVNTERIFYLHSAGALIPGSIHVFDSIYWSGNFEVLKELIHSQVIKPKDITFFIGYSGWSAGQLSDEINKNSWLVATVTSQKILFADKSTIWESELANLGSKYKIWASFPQDPTWN